MVDHGPVDQLTPRRFDRQPPASTCAETRTQLWWWFMLLLFYMVDW